MPGIWEYRLILERSVYIPYAVVGYVVFDSFSDREYIVIILSNEPDELTQSLIDAVRNDFSSINPEAAEKATYQFLVASKVSS